MTERGIHPVQVIEWGNRRARLRWGDRNHRVCRSGGRVVMEEDSGHRDIANRDAASPPGARAPSGASSFTPGPWFVDPDEREGMEYNNHVLTEDGSAICFMAHGGPARQAEFDANARLMAAAPDLYEALHDIASWLVCAAIASPEDIAQSFAAMSQKAEAAIAKVEGRP